MAGGGNLGVRLRGCDLVIDADPRNYAPGDDALRRLRADFGLPDCPTVETGGGGFHLYMRKPEDVEVVGSLQEYPGVEFKSLGRQVVAAGSIHPDTGRLYAWDPLDDDPSTAPMAPNTLLDVIRRRDRQNAGAEAGEHTPEELALLLGGLDARAYGTNDLWLPIAMAAHHATAGLGEDEFVAWCETDPEFADDGERVRKRWASFSWAKSGRAYTVKTIYRELHKAGRGDIVEAVGRASPEEDFPDEPDVPQSPADIALAEVNRSHFTVLHGGKYLVGRERRHPTLGHVEVEWFADYAVKSHLDSRLVTLDDGSGKPLGSWWAKHPKRRQYDGVVFDPSPERYHEKLYNLWRGWAVEPIAGDWSLMKRLLRDVLCRGDEASFDYVIRWAAFMVQKPHVPAEVALVFKGQKGVGKGTFARALRLLAGMHGKQVAQPEHFVGRFNEHLMDCILLFVDEGYWAGDKKAEGALKNLITEPVMTFEPKGRPIVSGPNMLHVVIASNEDWIVPASADERRFAAFEADADARHALPDGFFDALNDEMHGGGQSAMLHDLLALDLKGWHPRSHIPRTQALLDQKVQAFKRDPISFWWYRTLEAGEINPTFMEDDWRDGSLDIGSRDKEQLLLGLAETARGMGRHGPFTKTVVARFLRMVGVEVDAKDKRGNRVWRVPSLDDARLAFERHVGGKLEWDGE